MNGYCLEHNFLITIRLKVGAADRGAILLLSWDEPPITFEEFRLGDSFL